MCESSVVLRSPDGERVLMENVTRIVVDGTTLHLTGIFGERKSIKGRFAELDLDGHRLYVEE